METLTTALYRRYRPDTFADVIGQEHVTEPLVAAIDGGRINHAYLFSGPRGCGKTTSARIFARCLNCAEGPTGSPCGTCESCLELARGGSGSLDVVELDAASHGGVDDARDLRERAIFAPARDRYKIFIIDEAHMVTPQGFNALLKLVEEPPEHVKFVFATTEPEKVIGTIRSRTHHYPFRLVPPDLLSNYLSELSTTENIRLEDGVIPLVVRAGAGSVRDSLSVLDQLMAGAIDGVVGYQRAVALLGYTPEGLLDDAVAALAAQDGAGLFGVVEQVISSGQDPRRFTEDLLERFRDLIVVLAAGQNDRAVLSHVPLDQLERMRSQASHLGAAQCSRAADLVHEALGQMVGATSPRLQLELLCARLLLPSADEGMRALAVRLDRVEAGAAPRGHGAAGSGSSVPNLQAGPRVAAQQHQPSAAPAQQAPIPSEQQAAQPEADAAVPEALGPGQTAVSAWAAAAKAAAEGSAKNVAEPSAPTEQANQARAPEDAPASEDAPTQKAPSAGAAEPAAGAQDDGWPRVSQPGRGAVPPVESPEAPPEPRAQAAPEMSDSARAPEAARRAPVHQTPPQEAPSHGHERSVQTSAAEQGLTVQQLRNRWPEVLQQLARIRRATWALVSQDAQVVDLQPNVFTIGFSTAGLASAFQNTGHTGALAQAFQEALGLNLRIETTIVGASGRGGASAQPVPEQAPPQQPRQGHQPTPPTSPGESAQAAGGAPSQPSPQAAPGANEPAGGSAPSRVPAPAEPSSAGRPSGSPGPTAPSPSSPPDGELPPSQADEYDDYSPDDADVSGSDLVGPPLVAKMLGGTVIDETVEG